MPTTSNMHRNPANLPLAYFITIRTYGTWLHDDDRGSVDARHNQYATPRLAPNLPRSKVAASKMNHPPMILAADSAALVEHTIAEVCEHRHWRLRIAKARTNHVHIVVNAALSAERMMNDFKAWSTRRLREHGYAHENQTVWVEHGSTPYLWSELHLLGAIEYVKNWQGGPLQKTWDEVVKELAGQCPQGSRI